MPLKIMVTLVSASMFFLFPPATFALTSGQELLNEAVAAIAAAQGTTVDPAAESKKLTRLARCVKPSALNQMVEKIAQDIDELPGLSADQKKAVLKSTLVQRVEEKLEHGDSYNNMTIGTAVSLKVFSYDLARKRGAFNEGVGIGAPFRFYGRTRIRDIDSGCRANALNTATVDEDPKNGRFGGSPLFSITPTIYASKGTASTDLTIQPALILSFFYDTIHLGTGFNLSGPDQGNVLVLFGIGSGFSF